jgi:hypothetical protein
MRATFTEPAVPSASNDCPAAPEGFCGHGELIPFGQATDMIEFGEACEWQVPASDRRTITLSSGTIVLDEIFSNETCPGSCHQNPTDPPPGP